MCNCSVKLSLEKNPVARLAAWLSGSELTEGQSGKSLTRNDSFFPSCFVFASSKSCRAVLLTDLPSEMEDNLKPMRGVRKTRVFVRERERG